jgi:hypothetical protein
MAIILKDYDALCDNASTQILMLAGIVPEACSKNHGISAMHQSDGEEAHLIDQPVVNIHLKQKLATSVERMPNPKIVLARRNYFVALVNYMVFRRGPFVINVRFTFSLNCWSFHSIFHI